MALFDVERPHDDEEIVGPDAATRALSVTVVENDFVANVYEKLASVYDIMRRGFAEGVPGRFSRK